MRVKRSTLKQCSLGNFFVHVKLQSIRRKLPSCARVFGCVVFVFLPLSKMFCLVWVKEWDIRQGLGLEWLICLFTFGKNGYVQDIEKVEKLMSQVPHLEGKLASFNAQCERPKIRQNINFRRDACFMIHMKSLASETAKSFIYVNFQHEKIVCLIVSHHVLTIIDLP